MLSIIKSTLKLLLRNKIFWLFIIIMPVLSSVILNLQITTNGAFDSVGREEIIELEDTDKNVAYFGGKGKYVVKVYDCSQSELSEYMLNSLTESGIITVARLDASSMTKDQVEDQMHFNGYEDKMGAAIYLDKDFDDSILAGDIDNALTVYILSDDERSEALENELKMCIGRINNAYMISGKDKLVDTLNTMSDKLPKKEVVLVNGKNSRNLTDDQTNMKALVGYAFAILTLGFVFGGVLISYSVINERKDMVMTRLKLTNLSDARYFAAKFICGGIVSLMMTLVTGITTLRIDTAKMGMNRISFLFMIFMLGVIFCSISIMIGILFNDVMSASVSSFIFWTVSALLSGLYFPLDSASDAIKTMSYLMPSKWFMECTELLLVKDNMVYSMILCITAAYLIITIGLGSIGIKIKKND